MTVRFTLSQHGSGHLELGLTIDDDGRVTGYATGGQTVGRFARNLSDDESRSLREMVAEATGTRPEPVEGQESPPSRKPSGSTETLVADGLPDAVFDSSAGPPAGVRPLVELLRGIRDDLDGHPVAAITLVVPENDGAIALRHVGDESIMISGTAVTCVVTAYDADYLEVDGSSTTADVDIAGGEVRPGWELTLLDRLDLAAPPDGFLSVRVDSLQVDSVGDGVLRQAEFSWVSA